MGKTQRILSYLPPLYRRLPGQSPLYSVVDGVGRWLQEADSLLYEVMRAHWVDFADQGRSSIRDLANLAALYDLVPRDDEDVETFRIHLKHYVRTFLAGSATVGGVIRLAAATLALSVEADLEPHAGDPPFLVDRVPAGDDAAFRLLGFRGGIARGTPATPARLAGARDLAAGVSLAGGSMLQVGVDGDIIATVDVAGDAPRATVWDVARRLNAGLGLPVAAHDGHTLTLTAREAGPESEIAIGAPDGDAADALLGLAPQRYRGADAAPARIIGTRDHAPGGGMPLVNLSRTRLLRIAIDGRPPVEVDVAGDDPAVTPLDTVCDRINTALGATVARHDGHRLILASPTAGTGGRIDLHPAPAADARETLLGSLARRSARGVDATPARLAGRADLRLGVDLSRRSLLRLRFDGGEALEIDCAGDQPDATSLGEIVTRINAVVGSEVASENGRQVTIVSPTSGAGGSVQVVRSTDPERDAAEIILGVAPRSYRGLPPTGARLEGLAILEEPLDLRVLRRLWIAVDGASPIAIDVAGVDPARTTIQEVIDRINAAAATTIASRTPDQRIVLQSPTSGAASAIEVRAPETGTRRYFYSRGRVREDAATVLFGVAGAHVTGRLPQPARLTGTADLSRGVDLRVTHTLRIQVDDRDPVDVRVANPERPLVTLLAQTPGRPDHWTIVKAINDALGAPVASERDGRLVLISPAEGPQGRIVIGASTASDAGMLLLGLPAGTQATGTPAEQVRFVGMADLSRGLDVTTMFRLRVALDGGPLVEIDLRTVVPEGAPPLLTPAQVADALNLALGAGVAGHDGRYVILTSRNRGHTSRLRIEPAPADDATAAVFGIAETREYQGHDATGATLTATVHHDAPLDLRERRWLKLTIDGTTQEVDCAGAIPETTTLGQAADRINAAFRRAVAGVADDRLFLSGASHVILGESTAADASRALLGDAPRTAYGVAGAPAVLASLVLNRPVDLSARSVVRLRRDGGDARDVDIAGENPARTFPDEIAAAINAVFPGLAAVTGRQVMLTADRSVEVVPLRYFTLFEHLPVEVRTDPAPLHNGTRWSVYNASVKDEPAEWVLTSISGVDRPRLTHLSAGAWLQVNAVVPPGMTLHVRFDDDDRPHARVEAPGRITRDLSAAVEVHGGTAALILPAGRSEWLYSDCYGDRFDAAFYGQRRRRLLRPTAVPARFAGGDACHAPGVFNLSRFYDERLPGTESVYGTALTPPTHATSVFVHQIHQAGRFELQLPSDLPPHFGGRFNEARFAERHVDDLPVADYVIREATFDMRGDPSSLTAQMDARPGPVVAEVRVELEPGVPVYDVPFSGDRPLTGGDRQHRARAYLRRQGVDGVVELTAVAPGTWGNLLRIAVRDSETPGAYDVTIVYTGKDVFENARQKVAEQLATARAAGILAQVTRR